MYIWVQIGKEDIIVGREKIHKLNFEFLIH
jgi:hypothetical protein